jgi:hypothetical protein
MWEPRRLTTLWAFMDCNRDIFTLHLPTWRTECCRLSQGPYSIFIPFKNHPNNCALTLPQPPPARYLDVPKGGLFIECNGLNNYSLKALQLFHEPPAVQQSLSATRAWGTIITFRTEFQIYYSVLIWARALYKMRSKTEKSRHFRTLHLQKMELKKFEKLLRNIQFSCQL